MENTFVIGGARSGKSAFAERVAKQAEHENGMRVVYLATAQKTDAEMTARIARHRQDRPSHWLTVEEPLEVATKIKSFAKTDIILIDCLSLLLNNWVFLEGCTEEHFFERVRELTKAIQATQAKLVFVSNEVGQGIVPADEVTRRYRDWLGWLNQAVAEVSPTVFLVVAGIPIHLRKGTGGLELQR